MSAAPHSHWFRVVDSYCERTDATYWAEPLNAVSNVAFIIAAVVTWRAARATRDRAAQVLALGAAAIGVGSYLFHTHATLWALQADVLPIRAFLLAFVAFAVVRFFAAPWWAGLIGAGAFMVASTGVVAVATDVVGRLNGSVGYLPVPLLMLGMAGVLWRRSPRTAISLVIGGVLFVVSLFFRTIDAAVCPDWPLGTHFLWHALNGVIVGLMIVAFMNVRDRTPS